jgi:hypothetical protein
MLLAPVLTPHGVLTLRPSGGGDGPGWASWVPVTALLNATRSRHRARLEQRSEWLRWVVFLFGNIGARRGA